MPDFRYAQFCPVARACELLASRWTLLIVRDLLTGPLRFSDLQQGLPGVSTSVLSDRLDHLGGAGLVERKELPPPAASTVYALTEDGRALKPALLELVRWGVRLMPRSEPDDHAEARWIPLGLEAFASKQPTPDTAIEICIPSEHGPFRVHVRGGAQGTVVQQGEHPADVRIEADPKTVLMLAAGVLPVSAAAQAGQVQIEGDAALADVFPRFFEMNASTPN